MNIFRRNNPKEAREFERLIIALKKVDKPAFSSVRKNALRARVLSSVTAGRGADQLPGALRALRDGIRLTGKSVSLPLRVAVSLKVGIMEAAQRTPMEAGPFARHFRAALSTVMLLIFTVTALVTAPFKVPVSYAAGFLEDIEGYVTVLRDGRTLQAMERLSILEGDVISTHGGGSVTVRFPDDSVSRMGEDTGLEVRRLSSDPENPLATRVEIFLRGGRLWTRVVNLIDEDSVFRVETDRAVAGVPRKAAFDVFSRQDVTTVSVFDNMVDLVPADAEENAPAKTVIAGYQAQISGREGVEIEVSPIVSSDPQVRESTRWLAANMAKDEQYAQSLVDDTAASAATESAVDDGEAADFAVLNPVFEGERDYFLEHYNFLIKAETMFARNNRREGSRLLRSFRRGVNNLAARLPQIAQSDPVSAELLKRLMKERIAGQMKDFSGFLPGDALFPVKEALKDVELLLADSDLNRIQMRIAQAEGVLLDIQALLKDGNVTYAAALLNDYRERTAQIILKLDGAAAADFGGQLNDLIVRQVRQVKVLTAMEEMPVDAETAAFKAEISELRRENLLKILDTLKEMQGAFSPEILLELKDLFDTYLADGSDRDIVEPVFAKLLGQEGASGGLNFIQPDSAGIPQEVGVVLIVNMEATPEAAAIGGAVTEVLDAGGGEQAQD